MKTVKYIAEQGCSIKIGGVEYSGDMVIKGLSDEDTERYLKMRYIRKLQYTEVPDTPPEPKPEEKKPDGKKQKEGAEG